MGKLRGVLLLKLLLPLKLLLLLKQLVLRLLALRLLVLRLRGKQQLKPPGWRLKGLQLQKLLLLLPLLLLPAQTALISLEVEDTTLGCRLPISRLSIKPENEDLARTSEDCDILPTTTD